MSKPCSIQGTPTCDQACFGYKELWFKIDSTGNANEPWRQCCLTNSDYARDLVSRRSICGVIMYVLGILVSWQSKTQKSILLSSSEAEYIALFEAVNEVMFVPQLQRSMKISIKLPVMVKIDNVGTIFMASNITTTSCTKQMDIRYKCVNKYVKDGIVRIVLLSLLIMTAIFSPRT